MQLEFTTPSQVAIPVHLSSVIESGMENFNDIRIAILGICEYRGNMENKGCEHAPDAIRKQLYRLHNFPALRIADAGNIKMGESYKDSLFALKSTIHRLLEHKIIPIILGGDQTMLQAQELAYHNLYFPFINVLQVDERFHLQGDDDEMTHTGNYLEKIVTQKPNLIFNYIQLGYQSYFADPLSLEIARKMEFETHRLGSLREDFREVEPIVRDCDLMAFNTSSLQGVDGVGYSQPTPNGFTAEEACRIVRYAGLSDRMASVAFYDYNPEHDTNNHTAQVLAQAVWYFIQGVSNRKQDYPILNEGEFNKYIVSSKEIGHDITFLKSKKSDRWWIRLPEEHVKYKTHQLFPCSYRDYQLALKEEIPERWWKAYSKML
ncbi:MAG: formimidoylglutamase [Bacteroidetes bacterium]|nr:formimidoylglutamase [Bacteroidota bacterium]